MNTIVTDYKLLLQMIRVKNYLSVSVSKTFNLDFASLLLYVICF